MSLFEKSYKSEYESLLKSYESLETAFENQEGKWDKKFDQFKFDQDVIVRDLKDTQKRELESLKHNHKIEVGDLKKEIENFESKEISKLTEENNKLKLDLGTANQKIEMLEKIVDMSGDILDIKDLIKNLFEKIPNIEVKNFALTAGKPEVEKAK